MKIILAALGAAVLFAAGCNNEGYTTPADLHRLEQRLTYHAPAPKYAGQLHQPGAPVRQLKLQLLPAQSPQEGPLARVGETSCGRERWAVKTATDPLAGNIVLAPVTTTIQKLGELPSTNNGNPDQGREPGPEETVYRVTATLLQAKAESDGDFHLVLEDNGHTMVAEIPNAPACTQPPVTERVSVLEEQIEHARAAFVQEFGGPGTINHQVTITGVGFFDFDHGQTGRAPNVIELHPVLTIEDP